MNSATLRHILRGRKSVTKSRDGRRRLDARLKELREANRLKIEPKALYFEDDLKNMADDWSHDAFTIRLVKDGRTHEFNRMDLERGIPNPFEKK